MKRISLLICLSLFTTLAIAKTKITTYDGILKGYSPALGTKTGKIEVADLVTGLIDTYSIKIDQAAHL